MDLKSKTKTVIKSLLISSPKSLTINELDNDYTKFEGHAIPFASLGYPNLKQFLLSIPDTLTISFSGDIIPVASNSRSYHIQKFVQSTKTAAFNRHDETYRPPRLHPRIKLDYPFRAINHPQPVQASDFIRGNKTPFVDQLTIVDMPKRQEPVIKEQKLIPRTASNQNVDNQSALPFLDKDDPVHFLGLGTLLSNVGITIPCIPLTQFKSRRTYDVFVTEISRPPNFWFTPCSNITELNLMEEQLRSHVNDSRRVTMRSFEIVVGNCCLVTHEKKVLRAEFVSEPIGDKVKVRFVDYGTVDMVNISDCRRMDRHFAAIPRMCFAGALELAPIKNWAAKESMLVDRFRKMVRNKPLCGYVTQVDRKNESVRMVLIDTSDDEADLIVNRELLAF